MRNAATNAMETGRSSSYVNDLDNQTGSKIINVS